MKDTKPIITVKNVKYSEFMSHETNCFEATVYVDGKRFCKARNEGMGGETIFYPFDNKITNADLYKKITDLNTVIQRHYEPSKFDFAGGDIPVTTRHADGTVEKSSQKMDATTITIDETLEYLVDNAVIDWLYGRDLKRIMRKVSWYDPDNGKCYESKGKYDKSAHDYFKKKYPNAYFWHDHPFDEAVAKFRSLHA